MSLLLDMTYPSSFKGASFSYIDTTENGGRKTVIHEYPNKNTRFVEDLGLNQRTFYVTARLKGLFYLDDRKTLIDALNTKGAGIFTHPFLGNINCVCTGYSLSEPISSMNVADVYINLVESQASQFPSADNNVIAKIADIYREIYDFIKDDLNGQYIAQFANNITNAALKIRDLTATLNLISKTVNSFIDNDADFRKQLKDTSRDAYKISAPNGDIGGNISDTVLSFDSLTTDGVSRFNASDTLFGFGFNDITSNFNTLESIQRNHNQSSINGTINALALTNMIDSAKDIDYQDERQLDNVSNTIDANYDDLINNENVALTNELRDKIDEARDNSRVFFQQKRLVVNKIIDITTHRVPATVLVYQYYGNTDNYDEILALNEIFNPSVVSGDIKIVEAA